MSQPHTAFGMTSLSVAFGSVLRTNDYWRRRYPAVVAQAEENNLAKLWGRARPVEAPTVYERTMAPFLNDPFRGTRERRWRAPGETSCSMEVAAARGALSARSLGVDDIDLALVTSFPPDTFGVGNAAYFAAELGLRAPAWNYETACSGSIVGLHMAESLLRSGDYRRILVAASTSNSVTTEDHNSLGWFVGDGAGAFVVEQVGEGQGVLGWKVVNSTGTNNMFIIDSIPDGRGGTRLLTRATEAANTMARQTSEPYLRECVDGALSQAGLGIGDVDFWVFNTPSAWYADFCAALLGVEEGRYHSVYPRYANIGAALMPATLYHAIDEGKVRPGQVVALYSIGSTSTAAALVMRVGEIALGPYPHRPDVADAPTWCEMQCEGKISSTSGEE